jgi:hypothetical protein
VTVRRVCNEEQILGELYELLIYVKICEQIRKRRFKFENVVFLSHSSDLSGPIKIMVGSVQTANPLQQRILFVINYSLCIIIQF